MKTLSKSEKKEYLRLLSAYGQFWETESFQHGWSAPFAPFAEALPFLKEAAEIVTRIRSYLRECSGLKLPFIPTQGAGVEFLRSYAGTLDDFFVETLVEATLSGDNGLRAPCTPEILTDQIKRFRMHSLESSRKKSKHREVQDALDQTRWLYDEFKDVISEEDRLKLVANVENANAVLKNYTKVPEELDIDAMDAELEAAISEKKAREAGDELMPESEQREKEENGEEEEASSAREELMPESEQREKEENGEEEEASSAREEMLSSMEQHRLALEKDELAIEKVQNSVGSIKGEIQDLGSVAQSLHDGTKTSDKKELKKLHRKALGLSHMLMKELENLDAIHSAPAIRKARKTQVKEVQRLLDSVDVMTRKLSELQQAHDAEGSSSEEQQDSSEGQKEEEHGEEEEEEKELDLMEAYSQLRLKAGFEVHQSPQNYIITSFIPGCDRDSIKLSVSEDKSQLTIEGVRLPTQAMIEQSKKRLIALGKTDKINERLLRSGLGRFGRFKEKWNLDSSVDTDHIKATYHEGALSVTLPRVQRRRRIPQRQFYSDPRLFW